MMLIMVKKEVNNELTFNNLEELGKELNLSRQTASKRLKNNGWQGRLSFTKEELSLLKSVKNVKGNVKLTKVNINKSKEDPAVQILKSQVKDLNRQLTQKDHQIQDLNDRLGDSQKLLLMEKKERQQLQLTVDQHQKGFWARLFHKQ